MLEVENLHAYYGKSHILQGVDLRIEAGEVVSLLGRNGVGRSTTVKAIMGEVPPQGTIRFKGTDIAGMQSFQIARLGLGYVPENRDIFFQASRYVKTFCSALKTHASPASGSSTICWKCFSISQHEQTPRPA